jgi:hypothetical protein
MFNNQRSYNPGGAMAPPMPPMGGDPMGGMPPMGGDPMGGDPMAMGPPPEQGGGDMIGMAQQAVAENNPELALQVCAMLAEQGGGQDPMAGMGGDPMAAMMGGAPPMGRNGMQMPVFKRGGTIPKVGAKAMTFKKRS